MWHVISQKPLTSGYIMLHFAKGIVAERKGFQVNWAEFASKAQWWGGSKEDTKTYDGENALHH